MSNGYNGLFLSNGPGDPKMCTQTVNQVAKLLTIFQDGNYGAISCTGNSSKSVNNKGAMRLRDALYNNAKIFNDKNPYDSTRLAVQRGDNCPTPWCLGSINLGDTNNSTVLNLYTCFKEPCTDYHINGYWDKIPVP